MPSKEVFIPKKEAKKAGLTVGVILGKKDVKGEVGIEIEVEGKVHNTLPHEADMPQGWHYHIDGSLRGPDPAEYTLAKPIPFDKVGIALEDLWKAFRAKKSKIVDSNRTSVHVHLNCQQFYLNRLASLTALYFVVEDILTEWCGEYRIGNLFCLRAKDAPALATYFRDFVASDGLAPIPEILHYSGLNVNALKKFGSIEIRTLRGTSDPRVILDWVETLERLYNLSADFPDPREVCTQVSSVGPLAFFEFMLGPKATCIRQGISMTDNEICDSILEGVRIAQDICYCRDWSLYEPMKLKGDPFGRSLKGVAKKMMAADVDQDLLNQAQNAVYGQILSSGHPGQVLFAEENEEMPIEPPDEWANNF